MAVTDEPRTGQARTFAVPFAIPRWSAPALVMAALVVLWTAYFTKRTLDIHHGLGTSSFDSALYDQGLWLLSRFEAPFVTLMGRNLFGDHTSFILLPLVPLYWIAPGAWILFFSQSAAIAAGAIPVYLLAARRLGSGWLGVLLACVYLLHPAVSWANLENFHPDSFLGVTVGFAIFGAIERRWVVYWVAVAASLLVKEDVSLVIVPLGLWVALQRDRRAGLLTIAVSVAYMALAMLVVMRSLIGVPTRNTWRIPFGGPSGLIETALRDPSRVADHLRSEGRLWYLWQMVSSVIVAVVRRPSVAAISALVLFTNVLSTFWYQFHIQYHYSLVAVPALVLGAVWALEVLPERGRWGRNWTISIVVVAAALGANIWSPLPGSKIELPYWPPSHPVAADARDILADVPAGADVSAHYALTPHLAHRQRIYQFPNPFRVVLYGPDTSLEGTRLERRADDVDYVVLQVQRDEQTEADWASIRDAFELVRANDSWELHRRRPDVPLPPLAPPADG